MSASHPSEAEGRTPLLTSPEYEFGAALMHYEEMVQKHPNGGEEFGKARRRVLDLFRLAARSPAPSDETATMRGVTVRGGRVEVPTGFIIENCSFLDGAEIFEIVGDGEPIQYRGPAIPPSVEARDAELAEIESFDRIVRGGGGGYVSDIIAKQSEHIALLLARLRAAPPAGKYSHVKDYRDAIVAIEQAALLPPEKT